MGRALQSNPCLDPYPLLLPLLILPFHTDLGNQVGQEAMEALGTVSTATKSRSNSSPFSLSSTKLLKDKQTEGSGLEQSEE